MNFVNYYIKIVDIFVFIVILVFIVLIIKELLNFFQKSYDSLIYFLFLLILNKLIKII